MRPGPIRPGDGMSDDQSVLDNVASMRPGPIRPGDRSLTVVDRFNSASFNEARADSPGRSDGVRTAPHTPDPLQ